GRVIGGEEHDARTLALKIVEDARAECERMRDDAKHLAKAIVADARVEAERMRAEAAHARTTVPAHAPAAGHVDEVVGLVIRATVPGVALGEVVKIDRRAGAPLHAEVVGFRAEQAVLLPLGELAGVAPATAVWRTGEPLAIRCGDDLLGRVLDGLGEPL